MENPNQSPEETPAEDPYERIKQELQSMEDADKSSDSEEYRIEDEDIEVPEDEEQPNPNLEMDTKTDLLTIESLSKIMEEIATVLLPEYAKISAEFRKDKLAHLQNLEEYIKIRRSYKIAVDALIDNEINQKIKEYKLDNYFSQKTEELTLLRSNLIQTLRLATCSPDSELSLDKLKQILTTQGNIIEKEAHSLINSKYSDMDVSEFKELIEERSLEICASKYGLQPEDILSAIENSETKELVLQLAIRLANCTSEFERSNSRSPLQEGSNTNYTTTKPHSQSHSPSSSIHDFTLEMDGDLISVQSLALIYERVADIVLNDYITLTHEYRKERRKSTKDLKLYMEHKRTYSDKLEEAINKALADFCKKAKIDEKVFKKSLSYYISDDNPDVLSLKPVLLEALNAALPSTKELSQKEVKSILETQLKAVGKQIQNIKELVFSVKNPEQLASLIEELVADVIFEEHGCENEDVEASVKNFVDDQEIKDLLSKISESLTKLN